MVHVGPVRVLYLRDKLRLQPAAFGHLVGGQTLTPTSAASIMPSGALRLAPGMGVSLLDI